MAHIYIGTDSHFLSDKWSDELGWDANTVMKNLTGASHVSFVCNSLGGIYDGDVYRVNLKPDDCEMFFLLRTGMDRVPDWKVEQYEKEQKKWNRRHSRTPFTP